MWWLSLDGKLGLPFNEPDALQLASLVGLECGSADGLARAGRLALEPRLLLLAAAGHYETRGRLACDLEQLAVWLELPWATKSLAFAPVQRRGRRLLCSVQKRRESYLRHLRRRSDPVELRRQLRRLLRDCGSYPGKWKAGRLLRRWIDPKVLEQLAELELPEILHQAYWGEPRPHSQPGKDGVAARAAYRGEAGSGNGEVWIRHPVAGTAREPQVECGSTEPRESASVSETGMSEVIAQPGARVAGGAAFERFLQAEKLAALRQLAYGASHEINNPLANIAMRAEMLLRGEANPERERKLQVIRQQAMRAHEMISDLMLFANPPRPQLEEFELGLWLQRLVAELEPEVELAGGKLLLDGNHGGRVVADPGQLAEVVRALVRNALEAQPTGAQITIGSEVSSSGVARLRVGDNGPGISDDVARHMYDPFYSAREAGRGLGFGLSKAWRIAESHGGQLQCLSRAAGDTRFCLEWPRLIAPAKAA